MTGTDQDIFDAGPPDEGDVAHLPGDDAAGLGEQAARETDPQARPAPPPAADQGLSPDDERNAYIPKVHLLEERMRRQEAERVAQGLQAQQREWQQRQALEARSRQPEGPPDMFVDPEGNQRWWQQQREADRQEMAREIADLRHEADVRETQWGFAAAAEKYGPLFQEAFQAYGQASQYNPALVQAFNQAPAMRVGEFVVDWYKRQQTLAKVGPDLDAFRERELDQALDDPKFLARVRAKLGLEAEPAPSRGRPPNSVVRMPSLNRQASAASGRDADDGDTSDRAIFESGRPRSQRG